MIVAPYRSSELLTYYTSAFACGARKAEKAHFTGAFGMRSEHRPAAERLGGVAEQ